jgi:hypothetical protein
MMVGAGGRAKKDVVRRMIPPRENLLSIFRKEIVLNPQGFKDL